MTHASVAVERNIKNAVDSSWEHDQTTVVLTRNQYNPGIQNTMWYVGLYMEVLKEVLKS